MTNSAAGALNFAGGGKSTGNISVPASSNIMNFTSGTFDSNGVFSGLGTINVAGGTLNVNAAGTNFGSGSPNLNINGGTLGGTGTVMILGSSNWTSGTITGSSPFNVSSTGVMAITGSVGPMTLDGRVFNDNSSVVYNSPTNNLTLKNSASIVNERHLHRHRRRHHRHRRLRGLDHEQRQFNKTISRPVHHQTAFNNAGTGVSDHRRCSRHRRRRHQHRAVDHVGRHRGVVPDAVLQDVHVGAAGTTFTGGKVTIDGSGTVATSFADDHQQHQPAN